MSTTTNKTEAQQKVELNANNNKKELLSNNKLSNNEPIVSLKEASIIDYDK